MRSWPKGLLIAGLLLCLGAPIVGIILTQIGMSGAFFTLASKGISDGPGLAGYMVEMVLATEIALIMGILGLAIIFAAVVIHFTAK